jgi:hypothetical protein
LIGECNECKKELLRGESLLKCGVCEVDSLLDVAPETLLTCLKEDFLFLVNTSKHVDSSLSAIRLFDG